MRASVRVATAVAASAAATRQAALASAACLVAAALAATAVATRTDARMSKAAVRVLVYHDMEGLAGQDDWKTYLFSHPEKYPEGQQMLVADLNAVIDGLFAGGTAWRPACMGALTFMTFAFARFRTARAAFSFISAWTESTGRSSTVEALVAFFVTTNSSHGMTSRSWCSLS